jgi:hypothetical protein
MYIRARSFAIFPLNETQTEEKDARFLFQLLSAQ